MRTSKAKGKEGKKCGGWESLRGRRRPESGVRDNIRHRSVYCSIAHARLSNQAPRSRGLSLAWFGRSRSEIQLPGINFGDAPCVERDVDEHNGGAASIGEYDKILDGIPFSFA